MPGTRFAVEQMINHLRGADVLLARGRTVGEVCRRTGVSEHSSSRWRRDHGGLKVGQARRLKDLEAENARLKRAVAELTLDTRTVRAGEVPGIGAACLPCPGAIADVAARPADHP